MNYSIFLLLGVCCFLGCGSKKENQLKIAATAVPHAEILYAVAPLCQEKGMPLEIVVIDDYNSANRALAEKTVDANFFQHQPFLSEQSQLFGYQLEALTAVHIEPMGLYSKRYKEIEQLPEGAQIALPSDPSNQSRALELLQTNGLLTLKNKEGSFALWDIKDNSKNFLFVEVDAAFLPHLLLDVDGALVPTNFALQGGMDPKEALLLESSDSPFANIVAIRSGESADPRLQLLKELLHSETIIHFIETTYEGVILPVKEGSYD